MIDVKPANVSVAGPAEIVSLQVMVDICQETELAGITFPNQILPKDVGHVNLLFTPTELIQVGVRVLLEHIEGGDVVLPAVVAVIAEDADAQVGIVENEAAKIAHERLNAGA